MSNGNVPASQLRVIDEHGTRLRDWCAGVWARMVADARTDGVTLRPSYTPPPAPAGLAGYRDYAAQKWLYRHPMGPVAIARPGTSTHGLGNRLDVGSGADWVAAHMSRYGLWREFPSEPWHFGFRTSLAGLGLTKIIDEGSEQIMRVIYNKDAPASQDDTRRAVVSDLIFKVITGPQSLREGKLYGPTVNFTVGEWDAQRASVIENRLQLGLPVVIAPNGSIGGLTTADLDAAVTRILAAVPTPDQIATATAKAVSDDVAKRMQS